jgi:K+-transporting ATPase A subunit
MESQLMGILITLVLAFITGMITGKVLPLLGRKLEAYDDADEFLDAD